MSSSTRHDRLSNLNGHAISNGSTSNSNGDAHPKLNGHSTSTSKPSNLQLSLERQLIAWKDWSLKLLREEYRLRRGAIGGVSLTSGED